MSKVSAGVAIYKPCAGEMRLELSSESDSLFLTLSNYHVWFALNSNGADVAAEAAAMERLAELAVEAAARLRALADTTRPVMGGERR